MRFTRKPLTRFKKDLRRAAKRRYDLEKLARVIDALAAGEKLPARFSNHKLSGNWGGHWECHIEPDWLLIYYYEDDYLVLARTGTHADLFD